MIIDIGGRRTMYTLPALGIEKVLIGEPPRISSPPEECITSPTGEIIAASIIDFCTFESVAEVFVEENQEALLFL